MYTVLELKSGIVVCELTTNAWFMQALIHPCLIHAVTCSVSSSKNFSVSLNWLKECWKHMSKSNISWVVFVLHLTLIYIVLKLLYCCPNR